MTTPTPPSDLIAEIAQAMEEAATHWQDYAHLAQAAYAVVRERIETLEVALEPLVWEATTLGYTRWISDRRYRNLRPYARKWYRPACPICRARAASATGEGL